MNAVSNCIRNQERWIEENERTVAPAHFFGAEANCPTVAYLLNQGYCNAKCRHCYVNKLKQKPLKRSTEQASEDIQALRRRGYKVLIRGTEILGHREFFRLLPIAGQNYVQTNGKEIVRDPKVLEQLASYGVDFVIISFPFNDQELVDVAFDESAEAVKIASKNFGVTISMLVTKQAVYQLEVLHEFCELAVSLGARGVKFIRLMPVSPDLIDMAPDTEEAKHVLVEIASLKRFYPKEVLTVQTPGCFGLFGFRRSLAPDRFAGMDLSRTYDCPAGIKNFVISVDNRVYPCLYLMDDEMQLGTFKNGHIKLTNPERIPGMFRTEESAAYIRLAGKRDSRKDLYYADCVNWR